MMLFVNGCSHTAGSEIEFYMQEECREKAWPKKLADMNSWELTNIALAGSSNERIKRTTMDWTIKNLILNKNYEANNVLFIIMWSGFDRFEEWNQRLKDYVSSQSDKFYDEKLPEFSEYAKLKTIINTWASNEYKNLVEIYNTAIFLESVGVKYYFLNGVQSFNTRDKFIKTGLAHHYDVMYRGYGTHRIKKHLAFENDQELPKNQLKHLPKNNHARWDHWTEEGHLAWAGIVNEWLKKV